MKSKTPSQPRGKTGPDATRSAARPRRADAVAPVAVPSRATSAREVDAAPGGRATYRHGDLRRALLEAGIALARSGGPSAVVLREATRRAGVVPNAAYRHFAGHAALFAAVRTAALAGVARAMADEIAALPTLPAEPTQAEVVAQARACVRAVGTGYLRFALTETGLFRTAFAPLTPDEAAAAVPAATLPDDAPHPFRLLGAALDRLMEAGALPPSRRMGAEFLAWSSVHGMALLLLDGPLQSTRGEAAQALGQRLLDMVERGL